MHIDVKEEGEDEILLLPCPYRSPPSCMTMRVDCAQIVCAAFTIAWNFGLPKLVMIHAQSLNSLASGRKQLIRTENDRQAWASFDPAMELARESPPIAAP